MPPPGFDPWTVRPLASNYERLWRSKQVKAPGFLRQSAHEGGKVVSPTHRPPLTQEIFLALISVRGWVDPRVIVRPEGLCQWKKKSSDTIGNFFSSMFVRFVYFCSIVLIVLSYCVLWILPLWKIRRLRSGANPRSWVPEASTQTPRPPKPLNRTRDLPVRSAVTQPLRHRVPPKCKVVLWKYLNTHSYYCVDLFCMCTDDQ
jgi:hypothetical protein